jgi:hypothetical protein
MPRKPKEGTARAGQIAKGLNPGTKTPAQRKAYQARVKAATAPLRAKGRDAILAEVKGRGRPSSYRPEYCDVVVAYAHKRNSLTAIAHIIGVAPETLSRWQNEHDEFRQAVARAKSIRLFEYENKLNEIVDNGGDSSRLGAVKFAMTNVSPEDWRERIESAPVNVNVNLAAMLGDVVRAIDASERPEPPLIEGDRGEE